MPQSTFSVWILILTLCALLTACGGSSGSDPQPEPHQPPPGQSTPGDDNEPDDPGDNNEPQPEPEPEPEPEPITIPDSFSFAPQEDVIPGELVESNPITLSGITVPASISITNGEYKLGDGSFTAEDGHIKPGQSLTLRTTAPESADTTKEVVVTVGGVSGSFVVTTMEDKEPPEASIVFPNVISATENTELTIRGTAEDALSEIARVTVIVDGTEEYEVESEDNFASWQAKITLTPNTQHTITVSVEDVLGNVEIEAATAVVHQQAWERAFPGDDGEHVFERAEGMTYDEEGHRVFVADRNTHSVIEVDLATGERELFFKRAESHFYGASALVIDKPRNRLLVVNQRDDAVYSLNLEDELQPTLLTSPTHPDTDQPAFRSTRGIALDPQNPDRAFVTASTSNNLAMLDLRTGLRTLLSDNETPDGDNPFSQPRGLLVDDNNNRILVGSGTSTRVIFSVNKTTGKRTIFSSSETTGGDIDLFCPASLGSDRIAKRILVGDCGRGIIAIDIDTGERALIKALVDPQLASHGMHLYVEEGWEVLYYVDSQHRALLMLDLDTEEQVILSKGTRPD